MLTFHVMLLIVVSCWFASAGPRAANHAHMLPLLFFDVS